MFCITLGLVTRAFGILTYRSQFTSLSVNGASHLADLGEMPDRHSEVQNIVSGVSCI